MLPSVPEGSEVSPRLAEDICFLDRAYPDEIDIEFIVYHGEFGPILIQELSRAWNIPTHFMFIGSPKGGFAHNLAVYNVISNTSFSASVIINCSVNSKTMGLILHSKVMIAM